MKQTFRWAMKQAAPVLFVLSIALILIGVGQALVSFKNTVGEGMFVGETVSEGVSQWLVFASGTFAALSSAAIPFAAAAALYRWDHFASRSAE